MLYRIHPDHSDFFRDEIGMGVLVPVKPDVQFLLDWAIDVGGDNYRPTLQECREVLDVVLKGDT